MQYTSLIDMSSVFVLESDMTLPDVFISFIKVMLSSPTEWEKAKSKGKPPKPAMDEDVPDMYSAVCIELNNYSTTFSTSNGSCDISFLLSTTTGVVTPVIFHKILSSVGWNRNDSIRSRRPTSTKGTHEIQSSIK